MSDNILVLSDDNFESEIAKTEGGPLLVDFWAVWCAPCRMVTPILEELSAEYKGRVRVAKLDVDNSPATAAKYGIMSIPTLMLFKGGKVAEQIVGAQPRESIAGMVKRHLS